MRGAIKVQLERLAAGLPAKVNPNDAADVAADKRLRAAIKGVPTVIAKRSKQLLKTTRHGPIVRTIITREAERMASGSSRIR